MADGDSTNWLVYGYLRVSHLDGKQSQNGLEAQVTSIERYFQYLQLRDPRLVWGGWFRDEAVSASKKMFANRPEGKRLDACLRPGDQIIFAKLDRAFRNLKDLTHTIEHWVQRKIGLHFADMQIDLTTPAGMAMLQMAGVFAQWEASMVSVRVREAQAKLKAGGRPAAGRAPIGMRWVDPGKGRTHTLASNNAKRRVMQEIVRLRDVEGLSFRQISDRIERELAAYEKRPERQRDGGRDWHVMKCCRGYHGEKAILERMQGDEPEGAA